MTKTDKELAVEVAIALIEANPRDKIINEDGKEIALPSLDISSASNIIRHIYDTLQTLEDEDRPPARKL
ncbi:hypothetical protein [Dolosigranulum savutiense]|uniref:Uncharacterized protein n=1 Tax=Dolosigranulum savutiense TaxID=3110288 RepID=A0AB74U3J6_9LACT